MKPRRSQAADLRGFAWPLAAAERQREHQVDCARAQLALLERKHLASVRELDLLRSSRDQELRRLAVLRDTRMDPAVQRHAIHHLRHSLERQSACEQQAMRLKSEVEQARGRCAGAQQRLEAARQLREAALARYVHDQARREAKEADLAWLGRRDGMRAGRGSAEMPQ